jgi:membrane-bound lytic murein transglycosylase
LSHLKKQFQLAPVTSGKTIRLTRYAAFTVKGRSKADLTYTTPLLDLPADEEGMSEAQAESRRPKLLRFRYRREEILSGILPPGVCRPLAWLTRQAFEQAQMQGSVQVVFDGAEKVVFNVSRSNGRPWKTGHPPGSQERYWFFRKTDSPLGYGLWSEWQLPIFPMAALAGDLKHFGLGTPILLKSRNTVLLAVLADTGGAFQGNHAQLDLFLGIMDTPDQFKRQNGSLPERFEAFILE